MNEQPLITLIATFGLIFAAEFADKSQLVCMTLTARFRPWPVFIGAACAFLILNTLAILFGAAIAHWIPESYIALVVTVLFLVFGIQALLNKDEDADEEVEIKSSRSIIMTALLLITIAEFGDKTQLAVVALASTFDPIAVYLGATLALITTSGLGVWVGHRLVKKFSVTRLHQASGVIFILIGLFSGYQAYQLLMLAE
ncbi:TMEM165/GDT1 family protein [Pleionea litopenaei]|uniref:GDT1 family protein n=1 Tax=Pleionea litopenaei TaxID=3070815 RepID=A0AA51RRL0_9GAMM|nr:TMEM165/GDT1 family protein [Pleionea sp. HL-JVS1]WMS86267.1 TMEM165/GDT1 family protein [Pleionea sp. HL-JVS1]